jgi:hypothetical protein
MRLADFARSFVADRAARDLSLVTGGSAVLLDGMITRGVRASSHAVHPAFPGGRSGHVNPAAEVASWKTGRCHV